MSSPVDIRPDHLEIVQDILREHLPMDVKVWVFGSRANWTTKDSSDLDLAVEGAARLDNKAMSALEMAFKESDLPYFVDAVDLNTVGDAFKQIVEEQRTPFPMDGDDMKGMGAGWWEVTLGDVATMVMGQSPPGKTVSDEIGIPLLNGPTEFGSHHPAPVQFTTDPRKFAQPGDVLFCVRGSTTGRMNWADQEYAIGRGVAAIRHAEDPTLQPLLRGVIEFALPELLNVATGSTFPNVSASQIAEIPYPDLSLQKQRAIAHVLGTLDDKIELNRRMNETLEVMARALFKSWFVDFEPVRAKMEGRWRRGESLPGLPADLYNVFPDRLAPSELGEIPEGWEVRRLGECYNLTMGQSPPGKTYNDDGEGMPFFQGRTDFGFRYPANRRYCTAPKRLAEAHDTLVSVRAPVGDINMAWEECCIGRGVSALRHKSGSVSFTYCSMRALQPALREYEQTGTVFGAINKNQFEALPIVEPPRYLVDAFETVALDWDKQIRLNVSESRSLTAQRDALLPGLVGGEVRVNSIA